MTTASTQIVTRFAPSPTGYLHIGGARTALFNWAFARRHGGRFILRLEDTDAARSTVESTKRIIEEMQWLGIDWDEGPDAAAADVYDVASQKGGAKPYFQSQRGPIYREYIEKMFAIGRAYKCFKTREQETRERDKAKAEKRPYKYDRTEALNLSNDQIAAFEAEGRPFVVRFRMPDSDITVNDLVLGNVTIKASELEDFVIIRSDGGAMFHFANVVDDITMGVTHVLRAQEHLMNTPKHVAMFDALGVARPNYAHMPLIFNPDDSKMSKRDKAKTARGGAAVWLNQNAKDTGKLLGLIKARTGVDLSPADLQAFLDKKSDDNAIAMPIAGGLNLTLPEIDVHDFRKSGYLPGVILNYISLLGWSAGNDIERFDMAFLIQNFALDRIGKSNAKFDRVKLLAFNSEAIGKLNSEEFFAKWKAHLAAFYPEFLKKFDDARLRVLAESYRPRSRTLDEAAQNGRFFGIADDKIEFDAKAVKKVLQANDNAGVKTLVELRGILDAIPAFEAPAIHTALEEYATRTGKGLGDVAQPLRVAVSGSTVSPPINDTLAVLGRAATLARIDRCIEVNGARPA